MIGTLLLNRYELLEKIGEGGMGVVYKAKCHLLNRFVAVKILKTELSNDEDFVARFKREATSIAKLSHTNIVNIHDVGSENNINFIIMEYINGKTLKQVIKEKGRLSSQDTLGIVLQVAKALDCAHSNNIIHRDIKPDNIMITKDMIVKIMDFGIAKVMDSRTVTISNKVMGTVHYFSPEQAKGNVVDCRTDIYSLGIVMYEMVTGQVPYNAESSITIAMMHISELPTSPKKIVSDIPDNINQVILKAMEKEPMKRYQTADEMAKILMLIKENPNYKIFVNNDIDNATKIMETVVASDISEDLTTVMSQAPNNEKTTFNNEMEVQPKKKKLSKKKRFTILMASIILVMLVSVLGKFVSKDSTNNTPVSAVKTTPVVEKTDTKVIEEVPVKEMKVVPSFIGSTKEIAEQNVVNNGFLLGNVSSNYSNNIDKGLVISQSPEVNTSYEKDGKIDLVISQGEKITQKAVAPEKGEKIEKIEKNRNRDNQKKQKK
jgi:serine/threonine protein kinase